MAAPRVRGHVPLRPIATLQPKGIDMFRSSILFCSAALAACSGSPDGDSPPLAAEGVFTDTVVTLRDDGTVEESTSEVTAEQRLAEVELMAASGPAHELPARASIAGADALDTTEKTLPLNPACPVADLWLYDASMANRICVSGRDLDYNETDRLDLRTVNYGFACLAIDITGGCTQRAKWAGNVSFIWPGGYDGGLYRSPSDPLPSVFFSAGDTLTSVDPASAVIVEMYGTRLN